MKKPKARSLIHKTKRLVLRPLQLRDYERWSEAYSSMRSPQSEWDEANWDPKYLKKAAFRQELEYQTELRQQDKSYIFGIFRQDDEALIGFVSVMDISRGIFQNGYLGYRIFNPHWGFGYAKEAVSGAIKISFTTLALHRLEAGIQAKNKASIAVAKAAGLRKESTSKKRLYYHGKWIDLDLYVLTSEDLRIKYRFPKAGSRR